MLLHKVYNLHNIFKDTSLVYYHGSSMCVNF